MPQFYTLISETKREIKLEEKVKPHPELVLVSRFTVKALTIF